MVRLDRLLRRLVQLRREQPGDDLMTALVQVEEGGDRLGEDELISMVFLLLFAGHETTVNLIGNGVLALLQHVSFGLGAHYCLGAPLARLEARAAIPALLWRFPDLRLAVPPAAIRWRRGMGLRGLEALPVVLSAVIDPRRRVDRSAKAMPSGPSASARGDAELGAAEEERAAHDGPRLGPTYV